MMRRSRSLLLLLAVSFVLAGCPQGKTYNSTNTTINIFGPFRECTIILLPTGRGVTFGERDVTVRDDNTITVGGVTYTVNLGNCGAVTTTTTGPGA